MTYRLSKTFSVLAITAATLSLAASAAAQATQKKESVPGAAKVTTTQLHGDVIFVKGDYLVVKMTPNGDARLFHLQPGKTATIDGNVMPLNQVKVGTSLTAYVTVTQTPVVDRTTTTLKGTVWHSTPTTVILTLENGENRQYEVPKGLKFDVDGEMKEAMELRQGMKISATKVVEAPRTEVTESNVVIGTGPR